MPSYHEQLMQLLRSIGFKNDMNKRSGKLYVENNVAACSKSLEKIVVFNKD